MYKTIIWGAKEQYDLYINQIKYEELKGNIEILGIYSEDRPTELFDNYLFLTKNQVFDLEVDCVIVTSVDFHFNVIKSEILTYLPYAHIIKASVLNVPLFDMKLYINLLENPVSIVANTCWAGLVYNSLYLEFCSPFINLTIPDSDYIRMLKNLDYYLSQPLVMVRDRDLCSNPIGRIGDVEINFIHYKNFNEAEIFWHRRNFRSWRYKINMVFVTFVMITKI